MLNYLLATSTDLFADGMLLVALAAATSITALSYIAGEFFSMPSLRAFAKGEARELAVTAIIVLLAILLLLPGGIFDTLAAGFAPPGQPLCKEWKDRHQQTGAYSYEGGTYAFGAAGYFVGCKLESFVSGAGSGILLPKLGSAYAKLMGIEIVTGMLSTTAFGVSLPGALGPFPINLDIGGIYLLGFLAPVNEANTVLVDIVGALVSTIAAHKMLLDFFEINIPMVMLPLGLAARAFPFTRKTGSTIVAFCFAAYFVFPTTVLLNQRIYDMIQNPSCENLKKTGEACSKAADCCSGLCRAGKCAAPLTDFSEYGSSYAICQDTNLKNKAAELERILKEEGEWEREWTRKMKEEQLKTEASGGKTDERIKAYEDELKRRREEVNKALQERGTDVTFATPSAAWGLVGMFESATSDVAGLTVLVSLFVVNEIIFTLTLFRDFSLLIGGEARLFGLSKMV